MKALEIAADRQAVWSATANAQKSALERTRWVVFSLSILGALFATIAGQGVARTAFAMTGAAILALGTFLTTRLMGDARVAGWVRARAAAEGLKREAYKCAVRAAPYDGSDEERASRLNDERERIEEAASDLVQLQSMPSRPGSAPKADLSPDEYVQKRVIGQARGYYTPKAERYRVLVRRLGWAELALAAAATLLTAALGAIDKSSIGFDFDFVALAAVFTTISGAIVAHVESARYHFLVTTYRATARRLENELARANGPFVAPSPEWSAFVDRCEAIIADETGGWLAKWTR